MKKRKCFLWFPIRFTTYEVVNNHEDLELVITKGLLSKHIEKVKLYKINDLTFDRSFFEFFFGVAEIIVSSSDNSAKTLYIEKIRGAKEFMKELDELIQQDRKRVNITYTETNVI